MRGRTNIIEVRIQRVHVDETIVMEGEPNRIDPDKWRPLIMSFQQFYGLGSKVNHRRSAPCRKRFTAARISNEPGPL